MFALPTWRLDLQVGSRIALEYDFRVLCPCMPIGTLANRTFIRNTVSFLIVLAVSFFLLVAGEYFRARAVADDANLELYSTCITSSGEAC